MEDKRIEEAKKIKTKKAPTRPAYGPAPNRRGKSLRLSGGGRRRY